MPQTRLEYFKTACSQELYTHRNWCIRCMSAPYKDVDGTDTLPEFKNGQWAVPIGGGKFDPITDCPEGEPLLEHQTKIDLEPGDLKCLKEPVKGTSYGEAVCNAVFFDWAADGKIPYFKGPLEKYVKKTVPALLEDGTLNFSNLDRLYKSQGYLTLFADFLVYTYTPKSLTASPEALKILKELLEKYKDQLSDPAIAAMIDEAVVNADREYIKGDEAAKFFLKDKIYATVRKKMFYTQGGIARLDDPSKMDYIPNSLYEGIKPENLPAIINALRSGSYDRGVSTALGGEAAKFANRVFQNLKIAEDDCGTKVGKPETVSAGRNLVGRYIVGEDQPITEERFKSLIGKQIILRDPTGCKTKNGNLCAKCMGDAETNSKTGIGPRMAEMLNVFLSISLAAFHGRVAKTVEFNPLNDLH